jgi:heme-degrading monooxygenase HmoA
MPSGFAQTPAPPYYAVIFTARRSNDDTGYDDVAKTMFDMALQQPGCLGAESTRDETGLGITVSYWDSEDSIKKWKAVAEHRAAQTMGKERWYAHYELRVAKVERVYSGPAGR